jgi:hypothetical protein
MSGLDNSQSVTDAASLHAEEIHHEHHGQRAHLDEADIAESKAQQEKPAAPPA